MTAAALDVGRQQPEALRDGGLCWGDRCSRIPTPAAGPAVEADTLGLCPRCRAEIVGGS